MPQKWGLRGAYRTPKHVHCLPSVHTGIILPRVAIAASTCTRDIQTAVLPDMSYREMSWILHESGRHHLDSQRLRLRIRFEISTSASRSNDLYEPVLIFCLLAHHNDGMQLRYLMEPLFIVPSATRAFWTHFSIQRHSQSPSFPTGPAKTQGYCASPCGQWTCRVSATSGGLLEYRGEVKNNQWTLEEKLYPHSTNEVLDGESGTCETMRIILCACLRYPDPCFRTVSQSWQGF